MMKSNYSSACEPSLSTLIFALGSHLNDYFQHQKVKLPRDLQLIILVSNPEDKNKLPSLLYTHITRISVSCFDCPPVCKQFVRISSLVFLQKFKENGLQNLNFKNKCTSAETIER